MTARNIAKPIIAKQIPIYKIESVEFEAFTLGSLPLTFQCFTLPTYIQIHLGGSLSRWRGAGSYSS